MGYKYDKTVFERTLFSGILTSEQIGIPRFRILTMQDSYLFFNHYRLASSGSFDNKNCDEINKFTLILYRKTHHTIPQ